MSSEENPKKAGGKPLSRRSFLRGLLSAGVTAGVGLSPKQAGASRDRYSVCNNARERYTGALIRTCRDKTRIESIEERMTLLEGLHSSTAFSELARYLDTDTKERGVMRLLYPGAGSHIAPLYMAAKLIDKGGLKSVEFTCTDTDPCKQIELIQNLSNLTKVDSNFTFDPDKTTSIPGSSNGEGTQTKFRLEYKGHPIVIHFCLNCSGEKYYQENDFDQSDAYILHDSRGYDPGSTLHLVSEYFRSQSTGSVTAPSAIVMEDLTNGALRKKRGFDLELLGVISRGKSPYGHRHHERTKIEAFSKAQACRTMDEISQYDSFSEAKRQEVNEWEREGIAPELHMSVGTETGQPFYGNGVVLQPHPAILQLNPRLTTLLMDIGVAANNSLSYHSAGFGGKDRKRINDAFYEGEVPDLFSSSFLNSILREGNEVMTVVEGVNPKLAEGLAIRVIQILLKMDDDLIPKYIHKYHPGDPEAGFKKILDFFDSMDSHFSGPVRNKIKMQLSFSRNYLEKQKDSYSLWHKKEVFSSKFKEDRNKHWDEWRKLRSEWEKSLGSDEGERDDVYEKLYKNGNSVFGKI